MKNLFNHIFKRVEGDYLILNNVSKEDGKLAKCALFMDSGEVYLKEVFIRKDNKYIPALGLSDVLSKPLVLHTPINEMEMVKITFTKVNSMELRVLPIEFIPDMEMMNINGLITDILVSENKSKLVVTYFRKKKCLGI